MSRTKLVIVTIVVLTVWGLVALRVRDALAGPDASEARTRFARRSRAARDPRTFRPGGSYAHVRVAENGTLWAELLGAAGVPLPNATTGPVDAHARLVIVDDSDDFVLAPERAVVMIVRGPTRPASELVWGELHVPLAGFGVTPLVPEPDERVLAIDDTGAVLVALLRSPEGTRIRMGVDLAAALGRLRFGEAPNAGRDRDGNHELQPADLAPTLDARAMARPFADEVIEALLSALDGSLPCALPRTRGLPEGDDVLLVLTSDQDYVDDAWVLEMADALAALDAHATFMLTDPSVGQPADLNARDGTAPTLTRETADALLAAGHDVGAHPFPRTLSDVAAHLRAERERLDLAPLVARNHHLRWIGFVDVARVESRSSVAMNLDAMPVCDGTRPCVGFPGGAASPIAFIDEHGARLPILQQPTSVDDFSLRQPRYELVAGAADALASGALPILEAARRAEVPVVVNAHPALFKFAPTWLTSLLRVRGVRAISTSEWLAFVAARRSVRVPEARCGAPRPRLPRGVVWR